MTSDPFFRRVLLSDALLRVRSLAKVRRFYEEQLGWKVISDEGRRVSLSADGRPPALLILEEHPDAPAREPGAEGLFHLAFLYPDRAALAAAVIRLTRAGHPLQGASDHGVSEAIYLADPEGNGLELYMDRPPELWPRNGDEVEMGARPLDLQGLLRSVEAGSEARASQGLRLGHVHLSVQDIASAERTLSADLGMTVRQRNYPGARFLAFDGYHHHIAVNNWSVRQPAQPGCLGLEGFRLTLDSELLMRATALEYKVAGVRLTLVK